MRTYSLLLMLFIAGTLFAQEKPIATDSILVSGNLKKTTVIQISQLLALPTTSLPDLTITNHLGEIKGVAKNMKGVLLKTVLENLSYDVPSPKQLSEFYFVLIATDGYKVVYSWNELFNNDAGNKVFLITEKEGKSMANSNERILIAHLSDFKTGRRYIKALQQILVKRS
jgi:hypothetical protein